MKKGRNSASRTLYGFDIEGSKFSKEYVERKFEVLNKKVNILEVPVYRFIKPPDKIDNQLLNWFIDLASSYDLRFTAHADDNINFVVDYEVDEKDKERVMAQIKVAEKIDAMKIVFHQKIDEGDPVFKDPDKLPVRITIENVPSTSPFRVQEIAQKYGFGFTLDIPHMFLYGVNIGKEKEVYEWIKHLEPDHLHISNTYFRQSSLTTSLVSLLKGDLMSAFVKLRGDFHLPLTTGHINYRKVFERLKVPDTIIMEISTTNYEMLMKSLRRKSKVEKGYEEDIRYLKKLLKVAEKVGRN